MKAVLIDYGYKLMFYYYDKNRPSVSFAGIVYHRGGLCQFSPLHRIWLGLHSQSSVSDMEGTGVVTVLFSPLPVDTQSDNFSPIWVKEGVQTSFAF